jgi:hypothetical protein
MFISHILRLHISSVTLLKDVALQLVSDKSENCMNENFCSSLLHLQLAVILSSVWTFVNGVEFCYILFSSFILDTIFSELAL